MIPPLTLTVNLDAAPWTDLEAEAQTRNIEGTLHRVGLQRAATGEGHPVVWLNVTDAEGRNLVVQTTWRLFHTAHDALRAGNLEDCARAEA